MKKIIRNPFVTFCFRTLHPGLGFRIAQSFSNTSRNANRKHEKKYYGENEFLYQFAKKHNQLHPEINYYIFGHRHLPTQLDVSPTAQLIILGDWISDFSYLEITAQGTNLKQFIE